MKLNKTLTITFSLIFLGICTKLVAIRPSPEIRGTNQVLAEARPFTDSKVQILEIPHGWALEASFTEEDFEIIQEEIFSKRLPLNSLSDIFSALSGEKISTELRKKIEMSDDDVSDDSRNLIQDTISTNSKKPCTDLGSSNHGYYIKCEYISGASAYKSNKKVIYNGFVINVKSGKNNFFIDYWIPPYDAWSANIYESSALAGQVKVILLKVPAKAIYHNYFYGFDPNDQELYDNNGIYRFLLKGGPHVNADQLLDYWY